MMDGLRPILSPRKLTEVKVHFQNQINWHTAENKGKLYEDVGHALAYWLRHYATNRKVNGSRGEWVFLFNLPAVLGPGIHSASNRNEYQKQKNNVSGE
jgi:hypothetical protein